jgi:hypothetical protein
MALRVSGMRLEVCQESSRGILQGDTRGIIPNYDEGDLSLVEGSNAVSPGPREPGCNSFERGGASTAALNFDLDAEHRWQQCAIG